MTLQFPIPDEPIRVALIGSGQRARSIYKPLFPSMAPWIKLVAVCDPVREHCDRMAHDLDIRPYYDIHELVKDKPMEAALLITPIPSHYPLTKYLTSNRIHCHIETAWCSMVSQCRDMMKTARENSVIIRVAENFFRNPVDRFAQTVKESGYLGRIGRVMSFADHTGYHNNSRWLRFAGCHPEWVQAIQNSMAHPGFYFQPPRYFEAEILKNRFYQFPNGLFVMDTGIGHCKGLLGRHPRPGYTEWQGELGTLVNRGMASTPADMAGNVRTELRKVSTNNLAPAQEREDRLNGGGIADHVTPVEMGGDNGDWATIWAETPEGRIEYKNPLRTGCGGINGNWSYGIAIMDHCVDFALAVRGRRDSEFTDEDAMMSLMMDIGARESDLQEGRRIRLPLEGDLEADALERDKQKNEYGVDPFDIEGMLAIAYPKP